VHDACARLFGAALVARNHAADPLHLAGQITIVHTHLRTHLDQRFAKQGVGANRGDHHPGLRAQCLERGFVGGVGHDQGQLGGLGAELVAQGFKFGLRAPGSGPLQGAGAMLAKLFNQIAAQNLADKAGGAKNDDLVRGVFHVETFWVSQIIKRCSKPLCALPQRAVRWGARQ
jgi:hypothetical protein